jgi:hypothetical protein
MLIISFPRSGQNLLHRLLKHIYKYYKLYYSYCEFYNCCNHIPCLKKNKFQKNHDFDLNLNINENEPFFVLYRSNKISQLEAYFRYYYSKKYPNININYDNDTIFNDLIQFIHNHSTYYEQFMKKYIYARKFNNVFFIDYDDFVRNHKNYIKKIIIYLNLPICYVNIDIDVQNIIDSFETIEYKNKLHIFNYNKIQLSIQNMKNQSKKKDSNNKILYKRKNELNFI